MTLVEAALQVFHRRPSARLLLTAPGNYSTDLLVSHLAAAGLQPRDVLRLNDPRRATAQVFTLFPRLGTPLHTPQSA